MSSNLPTVRATSGLAIHAGPTVLGEKQVRIPTAGKIRPGIMVLTSKGAVRDGARAAYDAGVAAGKPWGDIEKDIRRACQMGEKDPSPLTPKNAPYFTVRRSDFTMPEVADRILQLYGEDRGEGFHLYRFPVVLPVDNWQAVLPHALKAYKRTELLYWSEYGPDGVRYCKTMSDLAYDEKAKRFVRSFGGRKPTLRKENEGRCDPEQCPQYQAQPQQCRLSGSFIFYIPQIPGSGAIELPMTSFYGLQGIRQKLEMMSHIRGRISGTFQSKPMFWLTKALEEVSMLDLETGKPKRVKQWITKLEADVDMTALLTAVEDDHEELGQTAVAVLEGRVAGDDGEEREPLEVAGDFVEIVGEGEAPPPPPADDGGPTVDELKDAIRAHWRRLRVSQADYIAYADVKYGEGWSADRVRMSRANDELAAVADDNRDDFIQRMKDEVSF